MNIALPTITFLFLLIPGFIFRRLYYTGEFSKEYFKSSFTDLLLPTFIPSILIHFILYYFITDDNYKIDTETLGILFSGTSNSGSVSKAFENIYHNFDLIFYYFLVASLFAFIGGIGCKFIVRKIKLDRKVKLFRFQNEWHYFFSGEILDFPKVPGNYRDVNIIFVDALVSTPEGSIIYSGILIEYVLTKIGGIDRIYLSEVKRRYLKDDDVKKTNDKQYYKMPGTLFAIPFDKVLNLHLTYYNVELEKDLENELKTIYID